ncbi:hypothetical protein D3C80_2090350 [compost metagenome]
MQKVKKTKAAVMCWYSVMSITCANGSVSPPNSKNRLLAVLNMTVKNCQRISVRTPLTSAVLT